MTDTDIADEVVVRLRADLLVIGDSIITDRHHASSGNYEADDPQNQIGGIIPAFSLSGWLRHGMERVVQERGRTVCHPGEANANFRKDEVYERDLDAGYHQKGACLGESDGPCVILDLFGGVGNRPGKVMCRPIAFSPVRSTVDHGQVVAYQGDRPVETAKNGVRRVGSHSWCGFGEFRVVPAENEKAAT